jgi:flagellar hook protein FlgE
VATHLAISGGGFFVARERATGVGANDPYYYTRAGAFAPDAQGYLRNAAGYYLHGWPIAADGTINSSPTDLTQLQPVRTTGISGAAEATSRVTLSANLRATGTSSPAAATYNPAAAANNMASGAVTADWQTSVQFFDSLGGLRTMTFSFLKADTAVAGNENLWNVEIHIEPASDISYGAGATLRDGQVAVGQIAFTPFGEFDAARSTDFSGLTIGGSTATPAAGAATWASALGLASQPLQLELGGPNSPGGLTQYNSPFVLGTSQVDGTAYGDLSSVQVDPQGFVTALFTNGLSRRIYQLPVANFSNPDGLIGQQGGVYRSGPDAGPLNLRPAGEAGAGKVAPQALEASTVDLGVEFTNLITTQRAYSASSKIITTADEMLDELIRLKR